MRDRYLQLMHSPPGRVLARPLGLPVPAELARHRPGGPLIDGVVLLGAAPGGSSWRQSPACSPAPASLAVRGGRRPL